MFVPHPSHTPITAARVATLVGSFDRSPAYAGLADALVLLIGDGRIGFDTRLPSERELTDSLGVSRTTVTRAYAALRDAGYAGADGGPCEACAAGEYKSSSGSATCALCASGGAESSSAAGAAACTPCPAQATVLGRTD